MFLSIFPYPLAEGRHYFWQNRISHNPACLQKTNTSQTNVSFRLYISLITMVDTCSSLTLRAPIMQHSFSSTFIFDTISIFQEKNRFFWNTEIRKTSQKCVQSKILGVISSRKFTKRTGLLNKYHFWPKKLIGPLLNWTRN